MNNKERPYMAALALLIAIMGLCFLFYNYGKEHAEIKVVEDTTNLKALGECKEIIEIQKEAITKYQLQIEKDCNKK